MNRTLLVYSPRFGNQAEGFEAHEIIEVVDEVTTDNIKPFADQIRSTMIELATEGELEVTVLAPPPFKVVVHNLSIRLPKEIQGLNSVSYLGSGQSKGDSDGES